MTVKRDKVSHQMDPNTCKVNILNSWQRKTASVVFQLDDMYDVIQKFVDVILLIIDENNCYCNFLWLFANSFSIPSDNKDDNVNTSTDISKSFHFAIETAKKISDH